MPPLRCVVVACLVFVLLVLAVALPSLWELALGWVLAIAVVTALPVALMAGDTGKPYPGTLFIARHRDFPTDLSTQSMFRGPSADRLGSAYDNRQIAAIALRIVGAKLGLSPREARDDSIFICSEAIDERYRNFGLQVPFDPAGYVAPRHFAEWDAVTLLWEIDTSQGDPRHAVAPPAPAQP
jgi:hypothetical protein